MWDSSGSSSSNGDNVGLFWGKYSLLYLTLEFLLSFPSPNLCSQPQNVNYCQGISYPCPTSACLGADCTPLVVLLLEHSRRNIYNTVYSVTPENLWAARKGDLTCSPAVPFPFRLWPEQVNITIKKQLWSPCKVARGPDPDSSCPLCCVGAIPGRVVSMAVGTAHSRSVAFAIRVSRTLGFQSVVQFSGVRFGNVLGRTLLESSKSNSRNVLWLHRTWVFLNPGCMGLRI